MTTLFARQDGLRRMIGLGAPLTLTVFLAVAGCGETQAPPDAVSDISLRSGGVDTPLVHLNPGDTVRLIAEVRYSNGEVDDGAAVEWSVSNTGVVQIDQDGLIMAVEDGAVVVTAAVERHSANMPVAVGSAMSETSVTTIDFESSRVDSIVEAAIAANERITRVDLGNVVFETDCSRANLLSSYSTRLGAAAVVGDWSLTNRHDVQLPLRPAELRDAFPLRCRSPVVGAMGEWILRRWASRGGGRLDCDI